MKFRPQFQLRFESEDQYLAAKRLSEKAHVSMNRWILDQVVEGFNGNGGGREDAGALNAPAPRKVRAEKTEAHTGSSPVHSLQESIAVEDDFPF